MTIALTLIGVLVVLLLVAVLLVRRSFQTGGVFAQKAAARMLRSGKFRSALGTRTGVDLDGLASGELTPEVIQEMLDSQPELVAKMAAEHGVDPGQASKTLQQFSKLSAGKKQQLIDRAQSAAASGQSPEQLRAELTASGDLKRPRSVSEARAAQKRKDKARAARKNGKRTRGR